MDLRLPIGGLFAIFGVILTAFGFITKGSEIYEKSLGINVNLDWGLVLVVFGALMLLFAYLGRNDSDAEEVPHEDAFVVPN